MDYRPNVGLIMFIPCYLHSASLKVSSRAIATITAVFFRRIARYAWIRGSLLTHYLLLQNGMELFLFNSITS